MATRLSLIDAHFLRHHIHVEKFAVDTQVFVDEPLLPNDVKNVTYKCAVISLKLLLASFPRDYTTEHTVLTRRLYEAVYALEHIHEVTLTNIVTSRSFM